MQLFQSSVLKQHLSHVDEEACSKAFEVFKTVYLSKIDNIKNSKEEQYQYGFLTDLFVHVLGYTLYPEENYNLTSEQKNLTDSKKADGAVLKDGKVIAVIELKSTKTKSMDKIVNQAFNYKNNHPTCKYIITSNFEKLRFYVEHSDKYEEFNLFTLNEERFSLLYALLQKESVFSDVPLKLKHDSKLQEENISNELYKKYAGLRVNLFENIIKNNADIDKRILLEKTQKLLDRMVFIFFAEDRGILPTNTIKAIVDRYEEDIEDRGLYLFYQIYFKAINKGNAKLSIPEYNGGLFAHDEVLDNLRIDDDVINECPLSLSAYDFNSDIDVNILGHIFENSLNDIEEMKAKIDDEDFDANKSKRKKDGVFYTPEYITKYIVDNTLGTLCQEKKVALGLDNVDIVVPKTKALNKTEKKTLATLESYREYLLKLKILDPACGSGAFLNQALNFLLAEHAFVDEGIKTLLGGNVLGLFDVKKGILENNLYGVDINAEAVEIAKLSLWLRTVEKGRKLNSLAEKIKVGNSLIDDSSVVDNAFVWEEEFSEVFEQGGFDVVIGNPPYVRNTSLHVNDKNFYNKKYFVADKQYDLYILFNELSLKIARTKGIIGFIQPNKFLSSDYGLKTLNLIWRNSNILFIKNVSLDNTFMDASVYPYIFIFQKNNFNVNFDLEEKTIFDICEKDSLIGFDEQLKSFNIIKKVEQSSIKLETIIDFIKRGIPNNKLIFTNEGKYSAVRSTDLSNSYSIVNPSEKIQYKESKLELTKIEEFSSELILLPRTILKIRAVLNNQKIHILDRIYYLKINDETIFNIKVILALLNTKLMTFLYDYFYGSTKIGGGYIDLKGTQISNFLIPVKIENQEIIINHVDKLLILNTNIQSKQNKFLKRISSNLEIEKLSKKLEAFYEHDFKTFLKELKKKKVTLSLVEQDEWEEYFEAYQKELLELQSQIDATDREIDKMVYELYGLSEDEIALVEGK